MKRFYKFLMSVAMMMALTVPWQTQAQATLTVADGTATDEYIPIYGWYVDEAPHSQFIYPASMLATMSGGSVTGMTFYLSTPATSAWGTTVTIKLMETTATTLSSFAATTGATTVWTGTVNGNTATWAVTFTAPYTYQGGNLLVDVNCSTGTYAHGYFTGVTQTGNTAYSEWESDDYSAGFLPKTTFAFVPAGDDFCYSPTNLTATVTGSDVDFAWTDTNASAWQIAYGPTGFNPNTATTATEVSATSYSLTGIAEGMYQVYVRAICSGDDTSAWTGPVPYNYGVIIMNMATSGTQTLNTCNATIYDDGGPTGTYSSNCNATLILNPADNQHALQISGTSETEGSYDYLTITDNDGTVLFCDNTSGDDSQHPFGPFISLGPVTVTFSSDNSVAKAGFEINVTCVDIPDCATPANFALEAVDSSSATFSWSGFDATAWAIGYGPAGFTLGDTNTMWEDFADTIGTISDLEANTLYDFYVMAVCGGDTSWTRMLTVRTTCGPIHTLPYETDFEGYTTGGTADFDPCWTLYNTYNTTHWPYVSSGSNNKYLYMYMYNSPNVNSLYAYAMLPPLGEELTVNNLELSFDVWGNSTTSYGRGVIVALFDSTYDATHPFDTVAVIMPTGTSAATATTQYVPISSERLQGKRIGFFFQNQQAGSTTSYYYCYIDNLSLHEAPECLLPANLHATYVGPDTIVMAWTDDVNEDASYLLEYRPAGVADSVAWQSVEVSEDSVVLEGLTNNTTYNIRLSALCSGDTSLSLSASVTTLAGYPISHFPYSCGFETYVNDNEETVDEASDWVRVNNTPNGWYVGTAAKNSGARGLYISNNNGSSNAYGTGTTCVSYAYATFHMMPGEYAFSFDWKAYGEGNYDYLRAVIAPYGTATPNSGWSSGEVQSGFTAIDGGKLNVQGTSWQTKTGTFNITEEGNYNIYFVWRNDNSSGTQPPAAVDNFQLSLNTCPQVTALRSIHVTSDSITVAWHGGNETAWVVSNGTTTVGVNDSTYTFDNLNGNTVYDISVRPVCGDSDTGMATIISVRTECSQIDVLPFAEDFEDEATTSSTSVAFIPCWHRPNNGSYYKGYPYVSNSSTYNHTDGGGKGLYWSMSPTATGSYNYGDYSVITLPELDTVALPVTATQISFWAKSSSTSYHPVFYVGVMTNPDSINTFQYYDTINVNSTEWTEYTVMLNDFVGYGSYVAIRANRPTSSWYAYMDDIVLDSIPTCFQPTNLQVLSTLQPDSVVVSWQEAGTATAWQLLVDTMGFNPDSATTVIPATSTSYTFTNLLAGVKYDVYVRADCGALDGKSRWTGPLTLMPGSYVMGVIGADIISMCDGAIYDDGGPVGKYSNNVDYTVTVYPTSPDSMLTFYGTAYTEGSADYLIIYEGENTSGNQLWRTSTSTQLDSIPMDTSFAGPITLKFHTSASTNYGGFEVFVRCVAAPPCSAVEGVAVRTTPSAAILTWAPGSYGTYSGASVSYKADDDTTNTWVAAGTTNETYFVITGLDPTTSYTARVSAICDGFNSTGVTVGFTTGSFACVALDSTTLTQVIDTIGNGTDVNSYMPYYTLYDYCVTQQIYTAEELGHAGTISKLGFNLESVNNPTRNVQIFMGHTSSATSTSWLTGNLTQVYNGPAITLTPGWNIYNLTTPFNYNGTDNLVIVFRDNTGDWSSNNSALGTTGANGVSLYSYRDGTAYDFNNMPAGTAGTFHMNLLLHSTNFDCALFDSCAAPAPAVVNVTATTATVAWAPGNNESSWNVSYRIAADTAWSTPVTVNTNSHVFTGLTSGHNYVFKVEGICGENNYSATASGTTLCVPISSLPYSEDFNHWGFGTSVHAPNCYTYGSEYNDTYPYIEDAFSHGNAYGGSMILYTYDNTNVGKNTWFALPMVDSNINLSQTQVVFNVYAYEQTYKHQVRVGVSTTPTLAGVTWIDTVVGIYNQWTLFEVPLSSYTGTGRYVVLSSIVDSLYSYPFVDDLTLEMIPTCLRPDSLTAYDATQNSVVLAWHERGNATNWMVEYGPRGFQLGTGTVVSANSNPFTLTGLPANYSGEYYVKSVCGATDTGNYSYMPFGFTTQQVPATIPYHYDFETETEWNNWQIVCNSDTNTWYRGSVVADTVADSGVVAGMYSMYVSNKVSNYKPYIYNAKVNAAIYRDIDFGAVDSSFIMTFRARIGGTTSAGYDGLKVYLVDPSVPANPSNENITSPWGDVREVNAIASARLDTTWQTYEIALDTLHGVHRLAFFWFNQNTVGEASHLQEAAAVDNIDIQYAACPRPYSLTAQANISDATLGWQGPANANYEVVYREIGDTNIVVTVNTNSFTLSNLTPAADYVFWVRKICGAGDSSLYSDGLQFSTKLCDGPVVQNYTNNLTSTTSSYTPIGYSYFNYGFVQTIIDSAALAGLNGEISHFAFHPASTSEGSFFNNMEVYMANVSESDLATKFIVPDSTHHFKKVIVNGNFSYTTTGWKYMPLDSAFVWDGHSNILITVNRKHGSYGSGTHASFYAHTFPTNQKKVRYMQQDGSAYDLTSITVTNGTATNVVGDIKLASCGNPVVCEAPVIDSVTATETTVTVQFTAPDIVQVAIAETWNDNMTGTTESGTSHTFAGLTAGTTYTVGVRTLCESGDMSGWTLQTITTDEHPCYAPTNLTITSVTLNGGTVSWTVGEEGQNVFEVNVHNNTYDSTFTVNGATTLTLTGLYSETDYEVKVRAVCGTDNYSDWSNTVVLTPSTCAMPTDVTSSNVTSNSAKISWTGSADSYEVRYGVDITTSGGQLVTVNATEVVLSDLDEETQYDVYVRAVCDGATSNWTAKYQFTTTAGGTEGINDVYGSEVVLYPNPASTQVTLAGLETGATVNVVDLNGRSCGQWLATGESMTIDLTGYAQGAYFVRIVGEQGTAVRKLIVK